ASVRRHRHRLARRLRRRTGRRRPGPALRRGVRRLRARPDARGRHVARRPRHLRGVPVVLAPGRRRPGAGRAPARDLAAPRHAGEGRRLRLARPRPGRDLGGDHPGRAPGRRGRHGPGAHRRRRWRRARLRQLQHLEPAARRRAGRRAARHGRAGAARGRGAAARVRRARPAAPARGPAPAGLVAGAAPLRRPRRSL
ncbi:MAG: hypothetical protein AVDCRST_MAG54-4486, partial [uncultured Actinomycetospora sp.]